MTNLSSISILAFLVILSPRLQESAPDAPLFDFEAGTYDGWTAEGKAFGGAPAPGNLSTQNAVNGYLGMYLANSFLAGDASIGRLVSRPFTVTHASLRFLVGGGDTGVGVKLVVDGEDVLDATGERSEMLLPRVWNVRKFAGKKAHLVIWDDSTLGWGHILADHFVMTDDPGGPPLGIGIPRKIYDPAAGEKAKWEMNDHCFVRDGDSTWHLFGIIWTEPMTPETDGQFFAHAVSGTLTKGPWKKRADTLTIDRASGETHLWAPHIVKHEGRYWMFYHGGGADNSRARIHLAVSADLKTWKRHEANPVIVDGFQARDPFLVRLEDKWVLYYTATMPASGGNHIVACRTSTNLVKWSDAKIVYRDPRTGNDWGPTESPFVIHRGDYWYLLLGSSVAEEFSTTRVFRSRDPFNWSVADRVGHLHVHAAELVQDVDGRWYASHCGGGQGGVSLAPVYWNDGLDDAGKPIVREKK